MPVAILLQKRAKSVNFCQPATSDDLPRPNAKQNRRATTPNNTPRPGVASFAASRQNDDTAVPDERKARPKTPQQRFFEALGWHGGKAEIVAGTNRPGALDMIDLLVQTRETYGTGAPHTRRWFSPDNLPGIERYVTTMKRQWGNVYCSVGTYDPSPYDGKLKYSRANPRPRFGFILDDVTDLASLPLPPTIANETSPNNHQVVYISTDMLSPDEAQRLAKGAALSVGADPSGADATQIIRIPGTLNTKLKCAGRPGDPKNGIEPEGWEVKLITAEGPRYTRAQLAAAFLPGGPAGKATTERKKRASDTPRDPAVWTNLLDGAALMATSRYCLFFTIRSQLAKLKRGERVILPTIYGMRDSGSEQVAVLVQNLITIGRKNDKGIFVPGLGAPPESEIRAIALHWRDTLRPGYPLEAYKADVDGLIDDHRPAGYAPEATRLLSGAKAAPLTPLAPATHRGRPAGQRSTQAERLAAILAERVGEIVSRRQLAQLLNVSVEMVAKYLADLRADERVDLHTRLAGRGLRVVRCVIKSVGEVCNRSPEHPPVLPIVTPERESESDGSTHHPPSLPVGALEPLPPAAVAAHAVPYPAEPTVPATPEPLAIATHQATQGGRVCTPCPAQPAEPEPPELASEPTAEPNKTEPPSQAAPESPAQWAARQRRKHHEREYRPSPGESWLKRERQMSEPRAPDERPAVAQKPMVLHNPPDPELAAILAEPIATAPPPIPTRAPVRLGKQAGRRPVPAQPPPIAATGQNPTQYQAELDQALSQALKSGESSLQRFLRNRDHHQLAACAD
jgi:hypothetical protein